MHSKDICIVDRKVLTSILKFGMQKTLLTNKGGDDGDQWRLSKVYYMSEWVLNLCFIVQLDKISRRCNL